MAARAVGMETRPRPHTNQIPTNALGCYRIAPNQGGWSMSLETANWLISKWKFIRCRALANYRGCVGKVVWLPEQDSNLRPSD
jgi:hypothetical protein